MLTFKIKNKEMPEVEDFNFGRPFDPFEKILSKMQDLISETYDLHENISINAVKQYFKYTEFNAKIWLDKWPKGKKPRFEVYIGDVNMDQIIRVSLNDLFKDFIDCYDYGHVGGVEEREFVKLLRKTADRLEKVINQQEEEIE